MAPFFPKGVYDQPNIPLDAKGRIPLDKLPKGEVEFALYPWNLFRPNPAILQGKLPDRVQDPWARRHAWRFHPYFNKWRRFRHSAPGLSWALGAFGVYVAYDKWYWHMGPGKEETEHWEKFMQEREEKLAKLNAHGHH
ncbi:hypothetical protein HDV00_006179 [Rhizophlyctis rosea]|nr:hypothetical protein HDV00_006179 [Rhizophlyctis rosea]